MKFNSYMEKCVDDDVIQLKDAIYKIGKLKNAIEYGLRDSNKIPSSLFQALKEWGISSNSLTITTTQNILTNGIDAEILRISAKGWQKGTFKINVTLEFIPDEPDNSQPESPLDDLRETLKIDS